MMFMFSMLFGTNRVSKGYNNREEKNPHMRFHKIFFMTTFIYERNEMSFTKEKRSDDNKKM
jgi:hypothetical protein